MESVSNFIIHNLNPLKPFGKFLFRKFLGDFIHTEDINWDKFGTEGLLNLIIDPKKLNQLLEDQPFVCQSGVVNRVQISTISQDKIAILVDGIDLVMYPNSLKFVQAGNDDSDFKFLDSHVSQKSTKQKKSPGKEETHEPSFIEKQLEKMEIILTIKNVNIELKTERPSREAASFLLFIDQMVITKPQTISTGILQCFKFKLGHLSFNLKMPNQDGTLKVLCFQRIIHQFNDTEKGAIDASLEIHRHNPNKMVIRADIGSIQMIGSPVSLLIVYRFFNKISDFYVQEMILSERSIKKMRKMSNWSEEDQKMGSTLYQSFVEKKEILIQIPSLTSQFLNSQLQDEFVDNAKTSMAQNNPENLTPHSNQQPTEASEKKQQPPGKMFIDFAIDFQGMYVGVLKEEVPNTDTFEWIKEPNTQGVYDFSSIFANHFLFRLTDVHFSFTDEDTNDGRDKCRFKIFTLRLEDCDFKNMNSGDGKFESKHSMYESFVSANSTFRSEFQGRFRGGDSRMDEDIFHSVCEDMVDTMYETRTIFEVVNPKSTKHDKQPCIEGAGSFGSDNKLNLSVDLQSILVSFDFSQLNTLVDEISIIDKLASLKSFLISEMRICNQEVFRRDEKNAYYKYISENTLQSLVDILQKNKGDEEFIDCLKRRTLGATQQGDTQSLKNEHQISVQNSQRNEEKKNNPQPLLLNLSANVKEFQVKLVSRSDQTLMMEPLVVQISTQNIVIDYQNVFQIKFENNIEFSIQHDEESVLKETKNCSMDSAISKDSKKAAVFEKKPLKGEKMKHKSSGDDTVFLRIYSGGLSTGETKDQKGEKYIRTLIFSKDKKLIFALAKVGVVITPGNIESLMLFSKRLELNFSTLSDRMSNIVKDVGNLDTLFDQAYDFFQQESFIRKECNLLYNSLFEPFFEVQTMQGFLGSLTVQFKDPNLREDLLENSISNIKQSSFFNDQNDWLVVEGDKDELVSLKDHELKHRRLIEEKVKDKSIILHLELKNFLLEIQQNSNDPIKNTIKLLVSGLQMLDGVTYGLYLHNPKSYSTQLVEISSVDHQDQPVYNTTAAKVSCIEDCQKLFKEVWKKLDTKNCFMKLEFQQGVYDKSKKESIDTLNLQFCQIYISLGITRNRETFMSLINLADETASKIDAISKDFDRMSQKANMTVIAPNGSFSKDQQKHNPKQQTHPSNTMVINVILDSIHIDLICMSTYRLFVEFDKMNLDVENSLTHEMIFTSGKTVHRTSTETRVQFKLENTCFYISENVNALEKRDCFKDTWLEGFQQLLYIPSMEFQLHQNVDDQGNDTIYVSISLKKRHAFDNTNAETCSIYFNIQYLEPLMSISDIISSFLETSTSETKFLFKNQSQKLTEIINTKKLDAQQTSKMRKVSMSDEEDECWFELANYDAELSQVKDYLETRFSMQYPENQETDKTFFKSLTEENPNKQVSVLRVDCYLPVFNLKLYDSIQGIRSKNQITKDFNLKIQETNLAFQAVQTNEVDGQKNIVSKIKYSIVGTIQQILIEDNLKDSIYEHLVRFDENSLSFYFRINETVTEFVRTTNNQLALKKSLSFEENGSSQEIQDQTMQRSRLKSEEIISIIEKQRYFDNVALVLSIKPFQIYIYNTSLNFIFDLQKKLSHTLQQNAIKNSPIKNHEEDKKGGRGPFYCVDYIFIYPVKTKVYALSSTHLDYANFIPNLEFTIKEKYYEFQTGVEFDQISKAIGKDFGEDANVYKIIKINVKHLPIIAMLYKTGKAFESMFRSSGNKNTSGFMSGLTSILMVAIIGILKTGKISVKLVTDILQLAGIRIVNQEKIDKVLTNLTLNLQGVDSVAANMKPDHKFQ